MLKHKITILILLTLIISSPSLAKDKELRATYAKYLLAIEKGNWSQIKLYLHSKNIKEVESGGNIKRAVGLMQSLQPKALKVRVASEKIEGNKATLVVKRSKKSKEKGTITFIKEKGKWKVYKESWKTKLQKIN